MKKLSFLLLLTFAFINVLGQQTAEPAFCKNPGGGIQVGGSFLVNPGIGCLDFANNSGTISVSNPFSPTGGALTQLGYIFDFKDGDKVILPPVLQTSYTVNKGGIYWILQAGNEKGTAYITCRSFEMIQTEQPDFKISSCGDKSITVNFLDTPKNRKHGKYRITWGDGTQTFSAQITVWPHEMQHTYASVPTQQPQIVAIYTRLSSNASTCSSSPIAFPVGSFKPRISELEGLNGGTSAKITLSEGLNGNVYGIQQKIKDGNWVVLLWHSELRIYL